jgi:surface polysaccharide O-acyltransferase-like enzyme
LPTFDSNLIFSGGGTEYYFLIGLAIIYLLNPILRKIAHACSHREMQLLLIILGLSTVGQTIAIYTNSGGIVTIFNYWFLSLFYFVYGQYYRLQAKSSKLLPIVGLILFLLPLLINLIVIYIVRGSGYNQDTIFESYFGPTVLVSSIGLFNLVMGMRFEVNKISTAILLNFSKASFGVYLIHGIVLDLLLHKTIINPYGKVSLNLWLFLAISLTFIIVSSYLLSIFLSKNKLGKVALGLPIGKS